MVYSFTELVVGRNIDTFRRVHKIFLIAVATFQLALEKIFHSQVELGAASLYIVL